MGVRGVAKVIVGVSDQQRAKEFWVDRLGFTVTTDAPYDDQGTRWLEVTSPDRETILILSPDPQAEHRRESGDERPNTNVFFYADDIEGTYAELSAKGVEFPSPPSRQPWGWWATFVDSEGNRFALQER
ncbi:MULTISPECIES: glyoxalase superfamily protein [Prauserella salsuginis group]|uniref:Glyoxalase superfamily protein n=1 Tax=Prauserella salsuginis TaxID=387889 RepID=A0ABW6G9X8_9PSEU|nr:MULTISPECIES: glyoxalase superfamily protein [Prauserella salsuginis group]MCR3721408.1 hypothetical protein [Prauserella flava]MCR3732398.1 hypothetical protein [Prauserella salsuginis]